MTTEAQRLAREGMEIHEVNAPEYIVCAALLRLQSTNEELLEALITAMPFVEDAADDEVYKSHRVHKVLKEIRAAIAKAEGKA